MGSLPLRLTNHPLPPERHQLLSVHHDVIPVAELVGVVQRIRDTLLCAAPVDLGTCQEPNRR